MPPLILVTKSFTQRILQSPKERNLKFTGDKNALCFLLNLLLKYSPRTHDDMVQAQLIMINGHNLTIDDLKQGASRFKRLPKNYEFTQNALQYFPKSLIDRMNKESKK